jgi:hypothetical protein
MTSRGDSPTWNDQHAVVSEGHRYVFAEGLGHLQSHISTENAYTRKISLLDMQFRHAQSKMTCRHMQYIGRYIRKVGMQGPMALMLGHEWQHIYISIYGKSISIYILSCTLRRGSVK